MDKYNTFHTRTTYSLIRLDWAVLMFVCIALLFYNYLQVRVGAISATYARACERFVQALLYVEAAADAPPAEATRGDFVPAR